MNRYHKIKSGDLLIKSSIGDGTIIMIDLVLRVNTFDKEATALNIAFYAANGSVHIENGCKYWLATWIKHE